MRCFISFIALAVLVTNAAPTAARAAQPSGFATDAPTTPPVVTPTARSGPATPTPSLDNAPALVPADYARYMERGSGSFTGKVNVHYGSAKDSIPPQGLPVYLIPATPYTQWYVGLHVYELKNMGPRTQTVHHGGYAGLIYKSAYKRLGYAGEPDYTKPVPFTAMDTRAFHAVRTTRSGRDGSFSFTGLPAGSYLVLTHWPVKLTSTVYNTSGQSGFFGDYSASTVANTTAKYALFYFAGVSPVAVTSGRETKFIPDNANTVLGGAPCGPNGCGRLVIDQWLSLDERNDS